jgi:hypothetical protein
MFERFSSLWFNLVCCVIHSVFGVWLLTDSLGEYNVGGNTTRMPIYYSQLNGTVWPTVSYHAVWVANINIVLMLASFELITAVVHGVYSWTIVAHPDQPPLSIKYRYFEYAVTAPIMMVIISILFGLRDVYTLVAIAVLCATTMFFGVLQSWGPDESTAAHWFGWVPFITMWAIVWKYYQTVAETNDIPDFVVLILVLEFILFGGRAAQVRGATADTKIQCGERRWREELRRPQ